MMCGILLYWNCVNDDVILVPEFELDLGQEADVRILDHSIVRGGVLSVTWFNSANDRGGHPTSNPFHWIMDSTRI